MAEKWEDIEGYEGVYQVSDCGNVRSITHYDCNKRNRINGRILKPGRKENGYLQVTLCDKQGKKKIYYVHRLVMRAFVGECPDGCEVNHIDENKSNNCLCNLEYVSHKVNINYGSCIQKRSAKKMRAVQQFNKNGTYIREFSSTIEAEKETKIWHNNISSVCKGKTKTAGGYVWKYKEAE